MTPILRLVGVAALGLLAGCGPQAQEAPQIIRSAASGLIGTLTGGDSGPAAMPQFSRQAIEESGQNFILASVPQRGVAALLQEAGRNGPERTWIAEDGVSVTYERLGFVVATRGLGPDLMAADVSGIVAAIRRGGGEALRIYEYLDGSDQIVRHEYQCRIASQGRETITIYERQHATEKFVESCSRGAQRFENSYWIDASGVVWKSRQLISPPIGYLDSDRL